MNCTNSTNCCVAPIAPTVICCLLSLLVIAQFVVIVLLWFKYKQITFQVHPRRYILYSRAKLLQARDWINSQRRRDVVQRDPPPPPPQPEPGNTYFNGLDLTANNHHNSSEFPKTGPLPHNTSETPLKTGPLKHSTSEPYSLKAGLLRQPKSQTDLKSTNDQSNNSTCAKGKGAKPIVFSSYCLAVPTGTDPDHNKVVLTEAEHTALHPKPDRYDSVHLPGDPILESNDVVFTTYSLAKQPQRNTHKYHELELPGQPSDSIAPTQGPQFSIINPYKDPTPPPTNEFPAYEEPKPPEEVCKKAVANSNIPRLQLDWRAVSQEIKEQQKPNMKTPSTEINSNYSMATPNEPELPTPPPRITSNKHRSSIQDSPGNIKSLGIEQSLRTNWTPKDSPNKTTSTQGKPGLAKKPDLSNVKKGSTLLVLPNPNYGDPSRLVHFT